MSHSLFTATFRVACAHPRCPFCWIQDEDDRRYMRSLLNEYTLAPDIHAHLAASRGFCRHHVRLLIQTEWVMDRDGLGTATLYQSVLAALEDDLHKALGSLKNPPLFKKQDPQTPLRHAESALLPQESCLACLHSQQNQAFALKSWVECLAEEGTFTDLARGYREGHGACFPHLLALLRMGPTRIVAQWLLECYLEKLRAQRQHLDSYIRKHDVRFKGPLSQEERLAWIESAKLVGGDLYMEQKIG